MNATSSRRKIILVPYHLVLNLLCNNAQVFFVPEAVGMPRSAKVLSVYSAPERDAFGFIVEDASFEEIPEGMKAPELKIEWRCVDLHERIRVLAEKRAIEMQTNVPNLNLAIDIN